ncbi:uracil-DNA glycosylase [Mandrillus leucophaeus cytomegalovirus]|uniref:Uracil-DNA glycosylase n=1 Tax=Mandrillus leucophaeus cytomegalovirus TaxID=1654930 RepID=A0A0G2ULZ1_9BETA|nr:uracil-DNA glycosylase [Mandrillus leucophaeus cytomegalovirus]AKI29747.1 uracil-DNA glycosylase [Mandrillus leucophaeus cytomegalovirus]
MALKKWMLDNIPDNKPCVLSHDEQTRILSINKEWIVFLNIPSSDLALLQETVTAVQQARRRETVYPPPENVHRWSYLCAPNDVYVVIVGQDPYCDGSASGVAFGTLPEQVAPPSLQNVYRELARTVDGFERPVGGCLDDWCRRGVLLLNTVFTVVRGQPGSHRHLGWQLLSERVIMRLSDCREHLVFMLWGAEAQSLEYLIDKNRHLILKACHPSPKNTTKTFVGNEHFVLTNAYLEKHHKRSIDWSL